MSEKLMLYAGDNFYPLGGFDDFMGYYDSIEDIKLFLSLNEDQFDCDHWMHVVKDSRIIIRGTINACTFKDEEWTFEEVNDV